MTTIRKIVDSNLLSQVISIPASFQNMMLEITVKPVEAKKPAKPFSIELLSSMLKGSHTEALAKAIPENMRATEQSLDEIRAERLLKYEYPN